MSQFYLDMGILLQELAEQRSRLPYYPPNPGWEDKVKTFDFGDLERLDDTDIAYWYGLHNEKCPNCGLNLAEQNADFNLFPHWMGACKGSQPVKTQ